MTRLPLIDLRLALALNPTSPHLSGAPQIVRSRRNHDERRPAALRLSRRVAKSDYTANFVNLVEKKWSGEVKLDDYGTLVVFNDTS